MPRRRVLTYALFSDLAPLGWQQINLPGDYLWATDVGVEPDGFKPLRGAAAQSSLVAGE